MEHDNQHQSETETMTTGGLAAWKGLALIALAAALAIGHLLADGALPWLARF